MRFRTYAGFLATVSLVLLLGFCEAQGQVVSEVEVDGNERVSRDRILLTFGVRLGEELSPDAVREGIRRLYELGHFSDIQVHAETMDDGSLRFILTVEERPRIVNIDIVGADKIGDSEIKPLLKVREGGPFSAGKLEDSRAAILKLYEGKGFPYASVTPTTEDASENGVRVLLTIDEGTRVTVRSIAFEGNETIEDTELKKVMETKEDRWWRTDAFFDKEVLADDLTRIVDRYRRDGFIDAKALDYETEYDETGEKVKLTLHIEEGELYRIADVSWVGASDFAVDALNDLTTVNVGDVYRPDDADAVMREAYSWYGERGYIHARIYHSEDIETEGTLSLRFHVDEDEPAHIRQVHIAGNTRTKEKVIRRELTVKPGDLYQTSEVIASQRRIANLGFFNGPLVEFAESSDPRDIDLVFSVEERQTGRAGVGVSHTSEKGITGFLELTEGNLFGNGQFLDLKWEFGKKSTEVVLGFTEPWFLNRRLSVGFDIYDTDDRRTYTALPNEFYEEAFPDVHDEILECGDGDCSRRYIIKRERRGGDLRLGWPFMGSRNTMIYTKYTLEQVRLHEYAEVARDVVDSLGVVTDTETDKYDRSNPGWEWRRGLTTTVVRRTTDRRFHPRSGSYTRMTADVFGWAFGGDVEYQRYILDTRKYIPAIFGSTLMLRGRAGLVTGYGDPGTVPSDTRFELGGVGLNGVRGYENREILPEGSELYGGRTMALGTLELKFPITDEQNQLPIYGLFFVDAGNTWESVEDTHPSQLYWGAGAGVRVEVPVLGNLGIDMGYGFDDELGGDWIVHYQFGLDF